MLQLRQKSAKSRIFPVPFFPQLLNAQELHLEDACVRQFSSALIMAESKQIKKELYAWGQEDEGLT